MHRWQVISNIVKCNSYTHGAEIGVAYGRNLFGVLDACPELSMIAVDQWRPVEQVSDPGPKGLYGYPKMNHKQNEQRVREGARHYDDRIKIMKMPSVDAAALIPDHSLDFVFIDACHAEQEVREDIAAWLPKVGTGGVLMGHDIHYPSVRAAVLGTLGAYVKQPDDCWLHYA